MPMLAVVISIDRQEPLSTSTKQDYLNFLTGCNVPLDMFPDIFI